MRFVAKTFDGLTAREIYALLELRISVFVVEQQCAYPETDGRDPSSTHLLAWDADELVACARWYQEAGATVLGRIAVRRDYRGRGLGRELTAEALTRIGPGEIRISAQERLAPMYRALGFEQVSGVYDDFGLAHVDMVRPPVESSPDRR